jgi:hypothetical protein
MHPIRRNRAAVLAGLAAAAVLALAAAQTAPPAFLRKGSVEGTPAVLISSDKLSLSVATEGGSMIRLVLAGDPDGLSPFGNPERLGTLTPPQRQTAMLGHFVCVDGFGPPSTEERAAGLPMHGEAHLLPWELTGSEKNGATAEARFRVHLPLVHETLLRTIRMVDGENVVYVSSELENELAFDRPVNWGEHLTLGAPFLEPRNTVVDLGGARSKSRDYPAAQAGVRRLAPDRDFTWPNGVTSAGTTFDLRPVPPGLRSMDHTTTLMDPGRTLAWMTAINTERGYLVGMIFRRSDFPWLQTYEGYRTAPAIIRALEPATQPFDVPRRESISLHSVFDTPTYRWLPAKSKIASRFLLFYIKAPKGMLKVDDVRMESGGIVIEEKAAGRRIVIPASLPL